MLIEVRPPRPPCSAYLFDPPRSLGPSFLLTFDSVEQEKVRMLKNYNPIHENISIRCITFPLHV